MTDEQIENTFTYHKPFGNQPQRYEEIRGAAKNLAMTIQRACPESRRIWQGTVRRVLVTPISGRRAKP